MAEAYLHCPKALMRSRLWSADAQVDRAVLPTLGQMIHDQMGLDTEPESQVAMLQRYRAQWRQVSKESSLSVLTNLICRYADLLRGRAYGTVEAPAGR